MSSKATEIGSSLPQQWTNNNNDESLEGWRKLFGTETRKLYDGNGLVEEESPLMAEYQHRLRTFKRETYFAKPDSVSPLIAARLGWTNTSKDILTCTNCSVVMCVTFGKTPQKPHNMEKLCAHYRQQFASAHKQTCSFRYSCLDDRDHDKSNREQSSEAVAVIPEYLLSVIPSLALFDNTLRLETQINIVFDIVLRNAVRFEQAKGPSNKSAVSGTATKVTGYKCIEAFASQQIREVSDTEISSLDFDATSFLFSQLKAWASANGDDNGFLSNNSLSVDALWIGAAGWIAEPSTKVGMMELHCPCCLANASILLNDPDKTHNIPCKKRPRFSVEYADISLPAIKSPATKELTAKMDVMTSHRLFCPYVGGSLRGPLIGWQIIVTNLVQWQQNKK